MRAARSSSPSRAEALERLGELHVAQPAVRGDEVALVDPDRLAEPVARETAVADTLLVVDLDDVDILLPADAGARRREALDLEPLRAPAFREALQPEALLVEEQACPGARPPAAP